MQPYRCASARKRCLADPLSDQQFIYSFHLLQTCFAPFLYSLCGSRLDVDLSNLTQCLRRRRSCRSFSRDAAALGVFFWVFPNVIQHTLNLLLSVFRSLLCSLCDLWLAFSRDSDNCDRGFSELEQELHFHDISALSRGGSIFTSNLGGINGIKGVDASSLVSIGALHTCGSGSDLSVLHPNPFQYGYQKGVVASQFECWGDSGVVATSPVTDTSTNVDLEDNNQSTLVGKDPYSPSANVMNRPKEMAGEQKTLRRLVQNREAARKSRLRKKAYVQQLESSRLKLAQIEEEIRRARQQGIFIASGCSGDQRQAFLAFDLEYARWLDIHQRHINDLRSAVDSRVSDNELCVLVDGVMAHYDEIFRLKSIGAKADVFHVLSGMWTTPAERCFMWLGGFRSSELLKLLVGQLEPLTDQQLVGLCNLQQSSQQAEDALTQGMEALQQSLAETIASGSLGCTGMSNVADYMGQMAVAMSKLGMLENFLRQADLLRQQTLQQMYRILTTRQAARALLAINDYLSRLRALSSLWLARPRE